MRAMIKKSTVIKHFGSVAAAAEFFSCHVSAIYQWGTNIPRERELELMVRLPEQFPPMICGKATTQVACR